MYNMITKWKFIFTKNSKFTRRDILPFFLIRFYKDLNYETKKQKVFCYQLYFGWWNWSCTLDFCKVYVKH